MLNLAVYNTHWTSRSWSKPICLAKKENIRFPETEIGGGGWDETGLKETRKNKHQVWPTGIYYGKSVMQILQGDSTGSVLETDGRDIRFALKRNLDNFLAKALEEDA